MLKNSLLPYIVPYMLVNGATNFVSSKLSEKKIISNFHNFEFDKPFIDKNNIIIPDELKKYVEVLEKNICKENLSNLYNNITDVEVNKQPLLVLMGIKGKYDSEKNTLEYAQKSSIGHELLHLASSYHDKDKNITLSGFINYDKDFKYGKALNEGYTDLLARKLFNDKVSFYNEEVRIIKFLELLLNKDELQKYYFNNDLYGFIKRLETYMNKEDSIKFVLNFDLGFSLKKQANPLYKAVYTNLELQLCDLFKKHNKSLLKQIDYLKLLDESFITDKIQTVKQKIKH